MCIRDRYYQEQILGAGNTQRIAIYATEGMSFEGMQMAFELDAQKVQIESIESGQLEITACLLYTSPSPRDRTRSRMPSSA
mgnify:CR=1 FL=1